MDADLALKRIVRDLYVEGPWLMRKMMHFRLDICPFARLLEHVPQGSSVLDVGCGAGLFLALAGATVGGVRGVGFDSSAIAIETAQEMAGRLRKVRPEVKMEFLHLDVGEPWPAGPFDVVSVVDVLHHVPAPYQRQVFRMAAEHLKPGGLLLYKDMANRPLYPATMNRLHDLLLARQWIEYVPIAVAEQWAQELRLETMHRESMRLYWYCHDFRVFRRTV